MSTYVGEDYKISNTSTYGSLNAGDTITKDAVNTAGFRRVGDLIVFAVFLEYTPNGYDFRWQLTADTYAYYQPLAAAALAGGDRFYLFAVTANDVDTPPELQIICEPSYSGPDLKYQIRSFRYSTPTEGNYLRAFDINTVEEASGAASVDLAALTSNYDGALGVAHILADYGISTSGWDEYTKWSDSSYINYTHAAGYSANLDNTDTVAADTIDLSSSITHIAANFVIAYDGQDPPGSGRRVMVVG